MAIDPDSVGRTAETRQQSWTERDTMLYALGVGAGTHDLPFVTENSHDLPQRVLPTYGVIVCEGSRALALIGSVNWGQLVHGGQSIELFQPLPASGGLDVTARVLDLQDKGSGKNAVVIIGTRGCTPGTSDVVVETTSTLIFRRQGGFGGSPGQRAEAAPIPDRPADHDITALTSVDQALLYRLSGDRNPLHSDPWFAVEKGGFAQPILHGLCTYGFAGRALLAALCDDEPQQFKKMSGRFAAPVYPGESLITSIWRTGDGSAQFETSATGTEDQPTRVVLTDGVVEFFGSGEHE